MWTCVGQKRTVFPDTVQCDLLVIRSAQAIYVFMHCVTEHSVLKGSEAWRGVCVLGVYLHHSISLQSDVSAKHCMMSGALCRIMVTSIGSCGLHIPGQGMQARTC